MVKPHVLRHSALVWLHHAPNFEVTLERHFLLLASKAGWEGVRESWKLLEQRFCSQCGRCQVQSPTRTQAGRSRKRVPTLYKTLLSCQAFPVMFSHQSSQSSQWVGWPVWSFQPVCPHWLLPCRAQLPCLPSSRVPVQCPEKFFGFYFLSLLASPRGSDPGCQPTQPQGRGSTGKTLLQGLKTAAKDSEVFMWLIPGERWGRERCGHGCCLSIWIFK